MELAQDGDGASASGLTIGLITSQISELMNSAIEAHGRSVVRIVIKNKNEITESATGFLAHVGETRMSFMTARHNFLEIEKPDNAGMLSAWIRLSGEGKDHKINVIYRDDTRDVALFTVKLQDLPQDVGIIMPLEFSTEEILYDATVVLLGYSCPTCTLVSVRKGAKTRVVERQHEVLAVKDISAFPGKVGVTPYQIPQKDFHIEIKYNSPTTRGYSGSPVLSNGKVIGVHTENDRGERVCTHYAAVKQAVIGWLGGEKAENDMTLGELFGKLDLKITDDNLDA